MATKQLMLDIALDLFSENGVKGTSIRMITSKAGLSTASFYNHFSSKDELLKTMYEHYTMQHAKNGGVLYDYEEMLEMIGPIGLFEYLRESMAASFANEKLIKLTRVILMEQYTNETARDITMKDKALLIYLTEQMFVSMKEKGMIDVPDAALMGKNRRLCLSRVRVRERELLPGKRRSADGEGSRTGESHNRLFEERGGGEV